MFTIHIAAANRKDLPKWLAYEIERYRERGYLVDLARIKDDVIRETSYGCWDIYSYWGTPEEVDTQIEISFARAVKEKLYSSEDLKELVSTIWDVFIENYSDIDLFREDVLNVLRDPDAIRGLLCVLNSWSDRLNE